MQIQREITVRHNESRLNKIYKTLVEGVSEDGIFYYGRTYREARILTLRLFYKSGTA